MLAGKTVLREADNPRWRSRKRRSCCSGAPDRFGNSSTAIVAPLARVRRSSYRPYAVIGEDAHIGAGTQVECATR